MHDLMERAIMNLDCAVMQLCCFAIGDSPTVATAYCLVHYDTVITKSYYETVISDGWQTLLILERGVHRKTPRPH